MATGELACVHLLTAPAGHVLAAQGVVPCISWSSWGGLQLKLMHDHLATFLRLRPRTLECSALLIVLVFMMHAAGCLMTVETAMPRHESAAAAGRRVDHVIDNSGSVTSKKNLLTLQQTHYVLR